MKTITFDETKWKLVPIEPTKEMIESGRWKEYEEESSRLCGVSDSTVQEVYLNLIYAAPEYKPEADEDGWIKCDGKRPVSGSVRVDIKFRNGEVMLSEPAKGFEWYLYGDGDDIVAYRIVK